MARYALIDGYLATMRSRIRWRADLDDLVAEMEDHLYSTTEGMCARGFDGLDAQRATLERFGDPDLVQTAYASTQRGGLAMPTAFTNQAGKLAIAAAGAWLVAVAIVAVSTWFDPDGWLPLYLAAVAAVSLGGGFGLVAIIGVSNRIGGTGVIGLTGLIIVGVGVVASFVVTWAIPLWMALEGAGMLLFAFAARRSNEVPPLGLIAVGSAFLLGTITFTLANMAEIGWRDQWGDHPVAWFSGAAVGAIVMALGLFVIGRWLVGEEPVEVDAPPLAAT